MLITGASRGIGKAIARHFARLGFNLAITARDKAALESAALELRKGGAQVECYPGDACDFQRAIEIVNDCEAKLGPIEILINNAGTLGEMGDVLKQDFEYVWRTIEVNLRGPMAYTQAALPGMKTRNSGIILFMGSYAGIRPDAANPAYSTSKAALARYADSIAASLDDSQVQLFTLSPGLVSTDMTEGQPMFSQLPADSWSPIAAICELAEKLTTGSYAPLSGRFIHVNDDLESMRDQAKRIKAENLYSLRLDRLQGPST